MARPRTENEFIGSITVAAIAVAAIASIGCGDTDPGATVTP
jgi:hypothetical protein